MLFVGNQFCAIAEQIEAELTTANQIISYAGALSAGKSVRRCATRPRRLIRKYRWSKRILYGKHTQAARRATRRARRS